MLFLNRLGAILPIAFLLLCAAAGLDARDDKVKDLLKQGEEHQHAGEWKMALEYYEKAFAADPGDVAAQIAVRRARFEASRNHVKEGQRLLEKGLLEEALDEFQEAYALDPGSTIAEQELRRTYRMIREREEREKKGEPEEEGALLTPTERARVEALERLERLESVPELRPISPTLNTLKMNNQPPKVLYETVGKLAGINVIFDPEFQSTGQNVTVDLSNSTLQEALDYLAVLTKTYWKPLSENTIFVTNDNVTKRRDHEEMIVKVFYLKNTTQVQQLQEIATAVRSVTDIRRLFTYNAQNIILARDTADKLALAEKLIYDLDKPLPEVVVDVIVMEASRSRTRQLASTLVSGGTSGIQIPVTFDPRAAISGGDDGDDPGGGTGTSSGTIRVPDVANLGLNDFTTTLPGLLFRALLSDSSTRILQRPQVRAADGQQASLRLGDRVPFATGSFQPGVGSVGVSPLVSTQFQFADVGVNVDLTPKIHGEDEVSLHIEVEISSVRERIDVGGIEQPVIGQRTVTEDIRVKSGEVTLLGGLTQSQTTRTKGGVPGISNIPIIKWLGFGDESKETSESELLIALIPQIVRRPEISELNMRGIAAGSDQVVRVRYESEAAEPEEAEGEVGTEPEVPSAIEPAPETDPVPPAEPDEVTSGAVLRFDPPALEGRRGDTLVATLELQNGTDVYNAAMRFQFDPQQLRLIEVRQGGFLSGDGQQVIFTRNILNDAGSASIVLNRLPGAGGISGSGSLVELVFQAVGTGTSQVSVPEITIRDSSMQPVNVAAPVLEVRLEE